MDRLPLTRREFLESVAVAGSGVALAHVAPALTLAHSAPLAARPAWASKPMRWAQLTLVEDDPVHYSAGFWLDYFKRTRSDAVCLSAGGCVAFYPTTVPFHHRSAWLGDRDLVGELVDGCRRMGMSVLLRTDPHATYDDAKVAHPDWIAVDAKGQPRRHWSSPEMWVTCALGPYNFDLMTSVHREIVARYKPDGIFLNRWDGSGDCYCEPCRTNFRAATGYELPLTTDIRDPARRAYFLWRQQRLMSVLDTWNTAIQAIYPTACCIPNNGSGANNPLDDIEVSRRAPILVADRQARRGLSASWLVGKTAKEYRATMGDKPVVGLFGVGVEEPYRWKDSVTTPAEIRIWALDAVANGMRPWFSKFSGTLHDERWLKGVEDLYVWAEQHQAYLQDRRSFAQVAIVYSQQTAWFYGGDHAAANVEAPALGWYQALVESRIPFDMVHDRLLTPQLLAGYSTLILPNIAALSNAQCDQLRDFVRRGGNLIATYETSLYDEAGTQRKNFGLADLFAVDWTGKKQTPMLNSYLRLEHDALPHHAIFQGLEDAPRIINGVSRLEVTPRETFAETPLTLIPTYPDLPMEKVYPRTAKTDISCLYLRRAGGRVAYFPFDIDRTFWEVLAEDHLKVLRNTVLWATGKSPLIQVEGPGFLDVTMWRSPVAVTVHMVNLTNPMAMKGPYRTFFPVGPQTVTLRLPEGIRAHEARLLVANTKVPITAGGTITVPSILDHEVIAIDL
jgi:hypothetical protein